jgi:hypothetical protein
MVLVKILFFANENRIGFCELTIRQSLLHHPPANPIAVLRKGGEDGGQCCGISQNFLQ